MSEIEKLNLEIENILKSSDEAVNYLRNYLRRRMILKCIKWWIIIIAICSAIYYIPFLNWNATAVGRIVLIKWILPFYDWRPLHNARCLIDAPSRNNENIDLDGSSYSSEENCAVCENFDTIDRITNVTYDTLQNVYLFRDLPVIISDSHPPWPNNFVDYLESNTNLMNSIPCNVATNVFQAQDHSPKLRGLFKLIDLATEWFIHFRNCDFEAVKATRTIFPFKNRPNFISSHLPPYRSSWILLSEHYEMPKMKHLIVKDTVFVFQLNGRIVGKLKVQNDCIGLCLDQEFELNAGEALVFNARMWNFYYRSMADDNLTVTFIQEIEID